ncbi:hypothetical protein KY320_01525 [Candidatus Woesearchaeota archaeon]|nr:hypothetical protein [Candidatus Woesearchaeota archaeon]
MEYVMTDYEYELHFGYDNIIPEEDWIDKNCPIVEVKGNDQLLIEPDINNKEIVVIGIAGLGLKVKKADFQKAYDNYKEMLRR